MAAAALSTWAPGAHRYVEGEEAYATLAEWAATDLHRLTYDEATAFYATFLETHGADLRALAIMGLSDRYFLFTTLLNRRDGLHPWLFARCREVEADPDDHLDLWSRAHYKSSLITFSGIVQEILRDPEITIGLFSHTRPIAKGFLRQVKREFEQNELLKAVYSDVLWSEPTKQARSWSEDGGIIVRRRGNPKESTLEAWGLVDGQPTSKHYRLRVYDDVVTRESVTSPEMVKKTTEALDLSDNLGMEGGRAWFIGTRYHMADTYQTMIDRGQVDVRVYPATDDGTLTGKPVFLSPEEWEKKKRTQPTTIAAQMLQNPAAGKDATFNMRWLTGYSIRPRVLNVYIMCDPSKGTTKRSDRTAMAVIGVDGEGRKYLLDGVRHRMTLRDRWSWLKTLHQRWVRAHGVRDVFVGYERYGMQSDDEYFQERMRLEEYVFDIRELSWPHEGAHSKVDRVERLVPDMMTGAFLIPSVVWDEVHGDAMWEVRNGQVVVTADDPAQRIGRVRLEAEEAQRIVQPLQVRDETGAYYDVTRALIEELQFFPFGSHDDLCDATSRIYDMEPMSPLPMHMSESYEPEAHDDGV